MTSTGDGCEPVTEVRHTPIQMQHGFSIGQRRKGWFSGVWESQWVVSVPTPLEDGWVPLRKMRWNVLQTERSES